MMILPVNVEFVGAVSEIIINYYYWQEWKIVKKNLKLKLPMSYLAFFISLLAISNAKQESFIYSLEAY